MPNIEYQINSIEFKNNLKINLESDSITVIVGPNNSGKTTILRDIKNKLTNSKFSSLVIENVLSSKEKIPIEDLESHFSEVLKLKKGSDYGEITYKGYGVDLIISRWDLAEKKPIELKDKIISAFAIYIDTLTRLEVTQSTNNVSLTKDDIIHPIHYLWLSEELEEKVNTHTKKVFGFDLVIHELAGERLHLLVGQKPVFGPNTTRIERTKAFDSLLKLEQQGDGIKAFVGVLLAILASVQKIILIDEPENFLHPPQALDLGEIIGVESKKNDRQVFIATHSADFLKGLFDSKNQKIQILRIDRNHSVNILDYDECQKIWNEDPLLKATNLLSGLFHDMVIICESDVDINFYNLISKTIEETDSKDVFFTAAYGKEKALKIQRILNRLNIDNKCILDFDVIKDKRFMESLFTNNNLNLNDYKSLYSPIYEMIKDKHQEDIKRAGKSILSSEILNKFNEFNNVLKSINIYLVEVGELERFVPSKIGKSGKWLTEVIKDIDTLKKNDDLSIVEKFIRNIMR